MSWKYYGFKPLVTHVKTIFIGSCDQPPASSISYLESIGKMLDKVCDLDMEVVFTGDLNINWLDNRCPLKKHLTTISNTSCLKRVVKQPTRIGSNSKGGKTATCIDHIYVSMQDSYTKAVSIPVGCTDHNMIAIARKAKVTKVTPRIVYKRSFRTFSQINWKGVFETNDSEDALATFLDHFLPVINEHASVIKTTEKKCQATWVDPELKSYMTQRDDLKQLVQSTKTDTDEQRYRRLRNFVTK